jgi:hypothetical protein
MAGSISIVATDVERSADDPAVGCEHAHRHLDDADIGRCYRCVQPRAVHSHAVVIDAQAAGIDVVVARRWRWRGRRRGAARERESPDRCQHAVVALATRRHRAVHRVHSHHRRVRRRFDSRASIYIITHCQCRKQKIIDDKLSEFMERKMSQ